MPLYMEEMMTRRGTARKYIESGASIVPHAAICLTAILFNLNHASHSRPMLPTWQSSPVVPRFTPFNWDLLSVQYADSIYACIDTHRTIISEAYLLPDPYVRTKYPTMKLDGQRLTLLFS
jgi:hypothetical protein